MFQQPQSSFFLFILHPLSFIIPFSSRAKHYERTKLITDLVVWAAEMAGLLLLVFGGWAVVLRQWLEPYAFGSQFLRIALFLLALGIIDEVAFFGVRWWRGYWLNKKFGLSVQGFGGWLWDSTKEKLLNGIFLLLVMEMLFFLIAKWPGTWWIISGVALSLLMVIIAQLAPLILFPLFYKFKPLEDEDLRERLSVLAKKAGVKLDRIEEVNLSSKTRAANAALAGLGHTRRIILGDTLLRHFTKDEIETVIAHELGHYVGSHLWKRMAAQVVTTFLFLGLIHIVLQNLIEPLGYTGMTDPAVIPLMALVSSLVALAVLPPINTLMRMMEREADRYAIESTRKPWASISTLERLSRLNVSDPAPHRLVEVLFHSHPAISRRVAACRKWAAELGLPVTPPEPRVPEFSLYQPESSDLPDPSGIPDSPNQTNKPDNQGRPF